MAIALKSAGGTTNIYPCIVATHNQWSPYDDLISPRLMCSLFLVMPMSRDYDVAEHMADAEQAAEDAVEEFSGYEDFVDAIDAFAQSQIEEGNEVQMKSDAEEHAGRATDEAERAAVIRETDVRHEVGQALHGLLREYGHQPRQSFGADANARQDE